MDDVLAMTPQQTKYYRQAMERIQAKERLINMDVAQYPNMHIKDKRNKHKHIYRTANPESFENKVLKTTDLRLI